MSGAKTTGIIRVCLFDEACIVLNRQIYIYIFLIFEVPMHLCQFVSKVRSSAFHAVPSFLYVEYVVS